jgi:hypothetical protein
LAPRFTFGLASDEESRSGGDDDNVGDEDWDDVVSGAGLGGLAPVTIRAFNSLLLCARGGHFVYLGHRAVLSCSATETSLAPFTLAFSIGCL